MNDLCARAGRIAVAGLAATALTAGGAAVAVPATADVASVDAMNNSWPILRAGLAGDNVTTAQYLLNCNNFKGYVKVQADGRFGAQTVKSAKTFQRAVKLAQDGIIGANTWTKLIHTLRKCMAYGMSTPECVKAAQVQLRKHRYINIKVSGIFDQPTENAVRSYQKAVRLKQDGIIGPQVWQALVHR